MSDRKYYSWSRYWSNKRDNHVFERPNHSSYTPDLNEAGIYSESEASGYDIIETKEDVQKAKTETDNRCYMIPVGKVDLLGKVLRTVRN